MVFGREHHLPSYLPFTCPSPALLHAHTKYQLPSQAPLEVLVSSPALLPALLDRSHLPALDPQWTHTILPPAVRGLLWPLRDTIGYNLLALQVHNLTRALTKDPFSLQVLLA
jgi:hypothetical protein